MCFDSVFGIVRTHHLKEYLYSCLRIIKKIPCVTGICKLSILIYQDMYQVKGLT